MRQAVSALIIFLISMFVLMTDQCLAKEQEASLGNVSFSISCSSDAHDRFNRALALLHNMMYQRAENEFEALAKIEPDCAMAHWGIAMTQLHPLWAPPSTEELKKGLSEALKAESLKPHTKREMAYISAAKAFYEKWESVDHRTRIAKWEKAQEEVYREYPDDIDAGAFYALAHLATAPKGDKTFSHQKKSGALLEKLRGIAPRHPGLFHYTIHAYDNPMFASRAMEVAQEYDKIAPNAPHAQHMPSHIFIRMGMWPSTVEWNVRSAAAAKRQSKPGELSLHYIHAMDYLMYAYLQLAQDEMARNTLAEINAGDNYQDSFASAYGIAAAQARYPLELRQWKMAAKLRVRTHASFPWDKYPWHEAITYFARGLGAARSGDVDGARSEVKKLDSLYKSTVSAGQDYWAVLVDSQRKTIDAWATFSEGQNEQALWMMKKAAALEDSVDKHPVTPGAVLPARELLGDMLVELGKHMEAIDAYEASLRISPNRFNSLYGAGYAAESGGDLEKAKYYYAELVEMTAGSDSDRPSLKKAKEFMSRQ